MYIFGSCEYTFSFLIALSPTIYLVHFTYIAISFIFALPIYLLYMCTHIYIHIHYTLYYTGEFLNTPSHRVVTWFWEAVREFEQEQKAKLLQFVTG